jgi:hypothetical protein
MWESRRDFQRVWEGWEAGIMAFHPFHTLSFPWPAFGWQMLEFVTPPTRCATPPRKAYRDLGVLIACSTLQSPFIDEMKAAVEQWIMAGQRNTAEMQGAIGRGVLARRRQYQMSWVGRGEVVEDGMVLLGEV